MVLIRPDEAELPDLMGGGFLVCTENPVMPVMPSTEESVPSGTARGV